MRIQKWISACGAASRRRAEDLVRQGLVLIDGRVAKIGEKVLPGARVQAEGRLLSLPERKIYIALHKPRGVVTTMRDEQDRLCVASFFEGLPGRVFPVGRLDRDSQGLLLATNDGAFANSIIHPAMEVKKFYKVTTAPAPSEKTLTQLRSGVLEKGEFLQAKSVTILTENVGKAELNFVLVQGKNRQIRRMCGAVGLRVQRLVRYQIGSVELLGLPPGQFRELTEAELEAFKKMGK